MTDTSDPFSVWREWMAESERQWNSYLNEAMASEEFTRSMGQFMDMYLNAQKSMSEAMGRYFSSLNVASRTDVIGLGERLTAIDEKLDALSGRIDELSRQSAAANAGAGGKKGGSSAAKAASKPSRTKRPPDAENE